MSESFIQLPTDGSGKKTRTNLIGDVHQQITQVHDSTGNEVSFATAENQLPDNHNVTVSNHPSTFPLPAEQITTLTPPAAITGFATSSKQDEILTKLQTIADNTDTLEINAENINLNTDTLEAGQLALLTELQKKINATEAQLIELQTYMKILLQTISAPQWLDPSANQLRVQATLSSGTVTTVSTVSTVTNQSQIDSLQGKTLVQDQNLNAWYNGVRTRIN